MSGDEATQAALRDMARSIGGLESTVKSMVSTWQAQEVSASQGRRDLHTKIDAVRAEFHTMGAQVAGALKDIADMKPIIEAVKTAKAEVAGASKLGRWLWSLWIFLAGVAGWIASNWLSINFRGKP